MFFTPEELARSLVYKSKRSPKDALDKEKVSYIDHYVTAYSIHACIQVDRMMYLIKKRYQREPPDMKRVVSKMNQKCNDKKRELRKRRNIRPINEGSFIICMHVCQLQIIVFPGGAFQPTPTPNPTTPTRSNNTRSTNARSTNTRP